MEEPDIGGEAFDLAELVGRNQNRQLAGLLEEPRDQLVARVNRVRQRARQESAAGAGKAGRTRAPC